MAAEKLFENQVKRWLESQGVYSLGTARQKMKEQPCGYYTKRWGGGTFVSAGLPDMQIVVNGKCIEIEIKAPTGKASELQLFVIEQINNSGGTAMILYPKDFGKLKAIIKEVKHGNII